MGGHSSGRGGLMGGHSSGRGGLMGGHSSGRGGLMGGHSSGRGGHSPIISDIQQVFELMTGLLNNLHKSVKAIL